MNFEIILLYGFIREQIEINQQKIIPVEVITLCRKYYGEFKAETNAVKIYGDTAWNISPYYGEGNYFLINIKNFSPKLQNYVKYLSIKKIYIENYWKECAFTIIKRLFTLNPCYPLTSLGNDGKITYHIYKTETGSYGELRKDYGHFILSVDYNNRIYKIKLFKCGTMCGCYSIRYPKQSGNNMKRAIVQQINDKIVTEHNQVWKIKGNGHELIEIDPCTEDGITRLRREGKEHIILSIDEYEIDIIENAKKISMKEQEAKGSEQIAEAIKASQNDIDGNIEQQQQIGNNVINIVVDKGYTLEQAMMAYSVFEAQQNQISEETLVQRMLDYIRNVEQSMVWGYNAYDY